MLKTKSQMIMRIAELSEENEKQHKQLELATKILENKRTHFQIMSKENLKFKKTLEEIREYADALYQEELIDGSKFRLRSGMFRIKNKIDKVLNVIGEE